MKQTETKKDLQERGVTVETLMQELACAMDDCFLGEKVYSGEGIAYTLPNGQRFLICVKEM